jgi:hypothetical protein
MLASKPQGRGLGLDEPEVNACRDALSPVGFAGSGRSASVKAPSESSVGDKPHGQRR